MGEIGCTLHPGAFHPAVCAVPLRTVLGAVPRVCPVLAAGLSRAGETGKLGSPARLRSLARRSVKGTNFSYFLGGGGWISGPCPVLFRASSGIPPGARVGGPYEVEGIEPGWVTMCTRQACSLLCYLPSLSSYIF